MFYEFNQNNSGGSFIYKPENGISHFVVIEADDYLEATDRAQDIGLYFNGVETGYDCPCCGDRWHAPWEEDGTAEPEVYGRTIENNKIAPAEHDSRLGYIKWIDGHEGFIHYKDGLVAPFDY